MSQLTQSIRKLSALVESVHLVSDTLAESQAEQELDIDYLNSYIKGILDTLQEVVQELLVLQQEQDSVLAIKCGEV